MGKTNPLAEKLWNLTEDKKVTTTPSFMDTLAPLLAMLYFSGAMGGKKEGLLPTEEMAANEAKVKGAANDIASFVRPPGAMASQSVGINPLTSGGSMTPGMIMKFLLGMPGISSGFGF